MVTVLLEMKLLREVFAVCLVVLITSQAIEGVSLCRYKPFSYQTCYGRSTYCCPSISYSRSYYGTTYSSCCPYDSKVSNTRYCTNVFAAKLFCNARSKHCCPSQTYMSGGYRRGCCYVTQSATCQYAPSKARTCSGSDTYCCPYMSYAQSYFLSTYYSCCGKYVFSWGSVRRCSNRYETYWCRSPTTACCASSTFFSGSWHSGCCSSSYYTPTSDYGDGGSSSHYKGPNVGAIVGGLIGAVILIVLIATTVGVICSRRKALPANRGPVMAGGVNQRTVQGYPQVNPQLVGAMPYHGYPQQGPYVIQGGRLAPGAVGYHPSAPVPVGLHVPTGMSPFNAASTTAGEGASAAISPAPTAASSTPVGGGAQAPPAANKSALPADPPPAYDNIAFSE